MSLFDKVFNSLVVEGNERTAAQMANFYGTTVGSIQARISEIRTKTGFAVYANKRVHQLAHIIRHKPLHITTLNL